MRVASIGIHTLAGGCVALTLSATAVADGVDEVFVTAKRQEQALVEYPGSVSVINGDAVSLVGATHYSESINRAAGTLIQRNSGQESLTAIRSPVLSGPGSCGSFLFLEDSVPIRPVGFCNVNELFEVNSEQADSIEVLRGPTGVVYGSSAMHGAINILHAEPDKQPGQSVGVEAGPDDFYRGRVSLQRLGDTDFSLKAIATDDGGWRDGSDLREQKLNAALTTERGDSRFGLRLAATNLNQETAGFIQGQDAYRDERIARSNANPEAFRDAYAVRLNGHYSTPFGPHAQLDVRPYLRASRMEFLQHFLIGKPLEENGQESLGVLASLHFDLGSTVLLTGADLEAAQSFLKQTQAGPATDGAPAANAIRPAGKQYDYDIRSQVAAVYAQIEQPFLQRWRATAGLRLEHVGYDYDNRMRGGNTDENGVSCGGAGCLYNRPADRTDRFTNLTPKVGLSYAINDGHMTYLNVVRGYRAPDTSELYRLQRQQSIAELDSERLDSAEAGLRGRISPVNYTLAAFVMRKDNVIFRDSAGFNFSNGRTKHRGVEYELNWAALETLTLSASGTYAEHTYDFNRSVDGGETIVAGRDIDTAPRHINAARVNWKFIPSAVAELEWQSIGRYYLDAVNAHEYRGHDLLNLRVGWNVSEAWGVTARLNNLTDRAYADRADYAFGNYRYFPGRGRSLFLQVNYRMN